MIVAFTETLPKGYRQNFEGYLYNRETFVPLQAGSQMMQRTFYAVEHATKSVVGKIHFFGKYNERELIFQSPAKSPFGSFEFCPKLDAGQLYDFIQFMLKALKGELPSSILIRHHATAYAPVHTVSLKEMLGNAGFLVSESVPNHHIAVNDFPLAEKMHMMEKRRLRKCRKAGFLFREEPLSRLADVYDFVLQCRKERGWGLSMSREHLQKTVAVFPDNYKLFSINDGNRRVAATVAIKVNSRILYNFYPASLLSYQEYSPAVMLIEGLYQHCQEQKMELLDLGTSASESLQRFKAHMGGEVTDKNAFLYQL